MTIHEEYIAAQSVGSNETGGGARSVVTQKLPLALAIDGDHPSTGLRDTICITVAGLTTTAEVYSALEWLEIR